ncbi:MAG TPA: T9SS type A sorting domain-containing protein, partial [Chitinophagales bacterium]|nr:T9SS type A sorting domain-containing protein [Chitinophagales bacterium]
GGGSSFTYGISMGAQENFIIRNTIIRNLSTTSSTAAVDGILVSSGKGTCEISNNIIQTLKRNNAAVGSLASVSGIRISHENSVNEFRVFNNSISELLTSYTGAATANRVVKGIYTDDTGSGTITHSIWNNSISIDGSTFPNASTTCIELADGKDLKYIVKNNVFANFTAAQTGVANHYIIVTPEVDRYGLLTSLFDYNDWYIANDQGTSGYIGLGDATKYATLAAWKTGMSFNTGTDANSISSNPFFKNNTSNLHGSYLSVAIDGAATAPPAFITTDFDCQVRNAPHDIGFDDFTPGCVADGGVVSPASATVCAKETFVMSATGVTEDPSVTLQWMVSEVTGGPYSNVVGGSGATTIIYTTDKLKKGTFYYVLKATCPTSGSDFSNELVLDVKAFPTATISPEGPFNLCKGQSVLLSAPNDPNRSYQWEKKNEDITGATNMVYEASTKGNYKVTVTNITTGCKNTSAAVKINVYEDPVATITPQGPTTFCEGGSVVLQANTGAGLTYKWKKGSNYIAGATLSGYTATQAGNYKVEVTDANGCSKLSDITEIIVPCKMEEGAGSAAGLSFTVFPNPASNELQVTLPSITEFDVTLISVTGERMATLRNQHTMDVSSLAAGVYFVEISSTEFVVTRKFVKQ